MNKLFASLRTPLHERVEEAVKAMANRKSDVNYHRYLRDYYYEERTKITPQTSAADACEYARLFTKQEDHEHEQLLAERKFAEAEAKVKALRKSA